MQDKIRKIRYEIISSCFGSHDGETFLFAFLDHLQLFFQSKKPLAFLLWKGNECVYSSFRDLFYTSGAFNVLNQENLIKPLENKIIRLLKNKDYFITIHEVKTAGLEKLNIKINKDPHGSNVKHLQEMVLPVEDDYFELAKKLLTDPKISPRLNDIPRYVDLLTFTFEYRRQKYPESAMPKDLEDLNYEQSVLPLLESFRNILDDVFEEMSPGKNSSQDENKKTKPNLGNLFCAIKTIPFKEMRFQKFPYSVGLLLSSRQRLALEKWENVSSPLVNDALAYLEQPYSKKSRSAADVTFCSGIIDFGRQPSNGDSDRIDKENPKERKRQELEELIYPAESQKKNSTASLYYVPVHVNGIPWLVFFTFTPHKTNEKNADDERWEYNCTFYRQATQKALSVLRWRAEESYLEELATIVFRECVSWENPPSEIIRKVNNGWNTAARIFPFPRFSLCDKEPTTEKENIEILPEIPGKIRDWWVRVDLENPYFGPKQVIWGSVDVKKMLQKITSKLKIRIKLWRDISREESSHSMSYSLHLLKTPISALLSIANQLTNENEKIIIRTKIERLSELALFSIAITGEGKKERLIDEMMIQSKKEFLIILEKMVLDIISLLGNKPILGGNTKTEAVVNALLKRKIFLMDDEWKNINGDIQYHFIQIKAVLFEALSNVIFELASCPEKYCIIKLLKPKDTDLFIEIVNSTILGVEALDHSVLRCNSGSADLLGVTNLFNSSKALGFEEPHWFRITTPQGSNAMGVCVEIGKLLLAKR